MDRQYWDSLADHYQDDLLEISREDRSGVLTKELKVLGGEGIRVADLGCGPGSLLPFLVANFGEVIAVDYAEKLLGQARQRCRSRKVRFVRRDLSRGQPLSFKVEVVCCINALIDPDRDKRRGMLRSLRSAMSKKGLAVIVVPALESVFQVYHTLRMIREREGAPDGIDSKEAELMMGEEVDSFPSGIIQVGGTATKYWMREELISTLMKLDLKVRRVRKVEYPWTEEIENPPEWLDGVGPWDWLVICGGDDHGLQAVDLAAKET
ncbi:MAG: hypothetical protein CMP27_13095 [Roseibacillus sp.]|nr:hypothetical protein [Roseibacillus sp.]